jgi:hypothetical protein
MFEAYTVQQPASGSDDANAAKAGCAYTRTHHIPLFFMALQGGNITRYEEFRYHGA